MIWWTHRWNGTGWDHFRRSGYRSYGKRTGIIWRGKGMWYARRAGPISYFHYILQKQLLMTYMSHPRLMPTSLLSARLCHPIPEFSGGKTIQFFTYNLKEAGK